MYSKILIGELKESAIYLKKNKETLLGKSFRRLKSLDYYVCWNRHKECSLKFSA